jgi:hypothetical protein
MTSKHFLAAVTASLLLGAAQIAVAADAPKPPKITAAVLKNLVAAQTANNKKDYPGALAAVEAAKGVADRTPYDDFMIHRFAMSVHIGMNDYPGADVEAEAAADADPSVIPDADKAGVYKPALQLASMQKHNDKAAKYAKLLQVTTPPPDAETQGMITRALFNGGDYADATAIAQKNVDAAKAAGKRPDQTDLEIILSAQVKQKDEAGAEASLEQLVANYNSPEDWNQIMGVALTTKGMRDIDYVYMGRLMLVNGGKVSASDAQLVGSVANKSALYGDAEAMQKVGGPAPDAREGADKKTIPAQIAAEAKQGGEYDVKTAEALYGYGMYPEAEAAARLAQTKGGAKDPTEAPMVIAMAQAAQGKYADAAAGFSAITAPNPASARVVRLWSYYAKNKANPPAAPATAAAK